MSVGRQEAFELFRRDYEQNAAIEENKQVLKQRYAEAKSLGEKVNRLRHSISKSWNCYFHFKVKLYLYYSS